MEKQIIDLATDISSIVSASAAVVALVISVAVYWHGLKREIKLETIKSFSEIRKRYFNTKKMDDRQKLKYLNELEYFAVGVEQKIYDIDIVIKMSGRRLKRQYDSWIKEFIKDRRERFDLQNKNAYIELERMMEIIKKKIEKH